MKITAKLLEDAVNRKMADPSPNELAALAWDLNDAGSDRKAGDVMRHADKILGGFGVEAVTFESAWVSHYWQNIVLLYVNHGDTYDATLCYDTRKGKFLVTSMGDWVEENEESEE